MMSETKNRTIEVRQARTSEGAVKMIELRTFETTHSNDEFEGHPNVGGYQVVVSGLLRLHFCAGDFVTPMYEEYEIAEISLTGGGYDNGAGIGMGVTSSLTPSIKDAILADVIEGLSKEQFVLKELWGEEDTDENSTH